MFRASAFPADALAQFGLGQYVQACSLSVRRAWLRTPLRRSDPLSSRRALSPHHCLARKANTEDAYMELTLQADLHIHSINSGHAYGTLEDIFTRAADVGLRLAAVTDHGPSMVGTSGWIHFNMGWRAPRHLHGVRCLWGVELNVVDGTGALDLPDQVLERLDVVVFGFHGACLYEDLGYTGNTEAVLRALDNPFIDILSHPTHPQFDCDHQAIIGKALDMGVLPELNLSYLDKYGEVHFERFSRLVELTKAAGSMLVVNSDAHFVHEIGHNAPLFRYWDRLGLEETMILNTSADAVLARLGRS